jgi:hypothetical protein
MDFYRWLEPDVKMPHRNEEFVPSNQVAGGWQDESALQSEPSSSMRTSQAGMDTSNVPKVDFNPVNVIAQALQSDVGKIEMPSQSVVAQVDAILQEKLEAEGMKKWAIRLRELPEKGMVVMVGLEQYEGIDQVPYERVRWIIRESVAAWEKQSQAVNGNL